MSLDTVVRRPPGLPRVLDDPNGTRGVSDAVLLPPLVDPLVGDDLTGGSGGFSVMRGCTSADGMINGSLESGSAASKPFLLPSSQMAAAERISGRCDICGHLCRGLTVPATAAAAAGGDDRCSIGIFKCSSRASMSDFGGFHKYSRSRSSCSDNTRGWIGARDFSAASTWRSRFAWRGDFLDVLRCVAFGTVGSLLVGCVSSAGLVGSGFFDGVLLLGCSADAGGLPEVVGRSLADAAAGG